jgi:Circularly permutated YpsA SLOG family
LTRPSDVAAWIVGEEVCVLNVAGTRESTEPEIGDRVERFLVAAFARLVEG